MLKNIRKKRKGNVSLKVKKRLRDEEDKKNLEKFQEMTGKRRIKYAQDNSSHMKTKDGITPMLMLKRELGYQVPEYLKDFVESGMDIDQAFKLPTIQDKGSPDSQKEVNVNYKAVKKTMKNMERRLVEGDDGHHKLRKDKDQDATEMQSMLQARKNGLKQSIKRL